MSNKVTLTGHFTLLDGTPAAGTVLIRPSRSPILDLEGNTVIAGPQRFQLDAEGRFSADLPPTDDPTLGGNFTYHVMVTMEHTHWQVIGLALPAGMVSVDVLDPPAGVVKEYPTRAEWDALTEAAVAEMEAALDGAETARDVSVEARDTVVVARDETITARDVTLTARDTAVGAAGETETARTETFTARDVTVEARDATFTARSETITTAGEAESARDTAVGAAGEAETARDETTAALTLALAGKVTGTGMTLRHDTSVGTRVFLDHPGGSVMLMGDTGWRRIPVTSVQLPGLTEMLIRRTTHHLHAVIRSNTTPTAGEWEVIATLPPGFQTGSHTALNKVPFANMNAYFPEGTRPPYTAIVNGAEVRLRMEGSTRLHATLTTWAEPAWPTVSPGTPA